MLNTGLSWLAAKRKAYMSQTVTYSRAADDVEVLATVGRKVFRMPDEYGVEIRIETRDYLITAADLILSGAVVEPQAADRITEAGGQVYEVMSPGNDEAAWEYSDAYRRTLRIHTSQVVIP